MLPTATKVALRVFSSVLVDPAEDVYASWTPASCKRRFTAGEATRPVPRGAGMSCWEKKAFVSGRMFFFLIQIDMVRSNSRGRDRW